MSADTAITDTHAGDDHVDEHGHDEDHDVSDLTYIKIALALVVLTAMEVAASYMDLGRWLVPLLLVMMTIKFFTVVLYFMHLKFDSPVFKWMFYGGLGLAIGVYVVALVTFHYFD